MVPAITAGGRSFKGAALYYAARQAAGRRGRQVHHRARGVGRNRQPCRPATRNGHGGSWPIPRYAPGRTESGGRDQGDRAEADKAGVRLQPRMAPGREADQGRNDERRRGRA